MLTITGTNLATIKEPRMRAKYGAVKSENVSVPPHTPAHARAAPGRCESARYTHLQACVCESPLPPALRKLIFR